MCEFIRTNHKELACSSKESGEDLTLLSGMSLQINGILNFFIYMHRMRDVRLAVLQLLHIDSERLTGQATVHFVSTFTTDKK